MGRRSGRASTREGQRANSLRGNQGGRQYNRSVYASRDRRSPSVGRGAHCAASTSLLCTADLFFFTCYQAVCREASDDVIVTPRGDGDSSPKASLRRKPRDLGVGSLLILDRRRPRRQLLRLPLRRICAVGNRTRKRVDARGKTATVTDRNRREPAMWQLKECSSLPMRLVVPRQTGFSDRRIATVETSELRLREPLCEHPIPTFR